MTDKSATADAAIAGIATRQHGVVTAAQMVEAGIDRDGIAWRECSGRLHRLHRGVYAVGHRSLSWRGRWLAAVFAAGDGAVLSHTSAAALWQFLRPIPGPAHITVGAAVRRKPRPGLRLHRFRTLTQSHTISRHGIAVTTPVPRPLRASRPAAPARQPPRPRPPGRLLLPRPPPRGRDRHWNYHRGSVAMEDDHARDLDLRAHGIETRRYTGDQLEGESESVVADLREALGGRSAPRVVSG